MTKSILMIASFLTFAGMAHAGDVTSETPAVGDTCQLARVAMDPSFRAANPRLATIDKHIRAQSKDFGSTKNSTILTKTLMVRNCQIQDDGTVVMDFQAGLHKAVLAQDLNSLNGKDMFEAPTNLVPVTIKPTDSDDTIRRNVRSAIRTLDKASLPQSQST